MAIKVNANNILQVDLSADGVLDANKKTALSLVNYTDCTFEINDKTLIITDGVHTVTVNNASKLKYITSGGSAFQDIVSAGLFTNTAPITINTSKLNIKGATNFNDTIDLHDTRLTKKVKKDIVPKTSEDKGFTVDGGKGNDEIIGSMYSDSLKGGAGNDIIYGGKGNDKINGNNGSDMLFGEDGNDVIHCGSDRNVIYGGTGNDIIYGDSGYNAHYFKEGDGQDKLYMGKGVDIIVFDKSLKNTLTFDRDGNNLLINYGSSNDSVTIMNYFSAKYKSVDTLVFANYNAMRTDYYNIPGYSAISLSLNVSDTGDEEYWNFYYEDYPEGYITVKTQILNGNNNNNLLCTKKKYAIVTSGAGNDNVYLNSKLAAVDDVSGNDKYVISSLKNGTMLSDLQGNDEILINDSYKNINFIFDVSSDDKYNTYLYDKDRMFILNNATLNSMFKTKNIYIQSGVQINDYFNNGTIEKIGTKDYFVTPNEIARIRNNVRNWLKYNSYTTTLEAIQYASNDKKKELIAIYKDINWIKYTVNGTNKDDILNGTDYGENIYGNKGNDTIYAKSGDDYVDGGEGNDTYIFNTGDGNDTILNSSGVDTIRFNQEQVLTFTHNMSNNNLVISYGDSDSITLEDYFVNNSHSVTNINGTLISDLIEEQGINEIYDYTKGCDVTTIIPNRGINYLKFATLLTYIHDMNNNDLIINYDDNKSVTIKDYYADELSVQFINGHPIELFLENSVNEIYDYSQGCKIETITSNGGKDSLIFSGDLTYIHNMNNNDLIINYGNNQSVTVKEFFADEEHSVKFINGQAIGKIAGNITEIYDYTDGCTIPDIMGNYGTIYLNFSGNITYVHDLNNYDLIINYGENKSVTIHDYFTDEHYVIFINEQAIGTVIENHINEIYDYTNGCEYTTITSNGGVDSLKFTGDLTYVHDLTNNDLIINYGNNKSVTVVDYFAGGHSVQFINDTAIATAIENNVNEIYDFTNGCNVATITSNGGVDSLKFDGDITYVHDVLNDDLVINYGNNKSVTIKDYFAGGHSAQFINGTAISAAIENKVNEIYDFSNGCDIATITSNGGIDSLKFTGDIRFAHKLANNDLVISYDDTKTVTLKNYYGDNNFSVKTIKNDNETLTVTQALNKYGIDITGTNGNDTIIGTNTDDTITAGNGNDTIDSRSGSNTLIFNNGDGNDTIVNSLGNDTIQVKAKYSLQFSHDITSNDLIILYGYSGDKITLQDYYLNSSHSVKTIDNEGEILSLSEALSKYETKIIGTDGNDTYTFNIGDGKSTIINGNGNDTVQLDTQSVLRFSHSLDNNNLIMSYGEGDKITLQDYYVNNFHSVQTIKNGDETLTVTQALNKYGIDISGNYNKDDVIEGTDGNDKLDGHGGDDTLIGGKGDDTLNGQGGNDILIGGTGNNLLCGNDGDDTYIISMSNGSFNEVHYEGNGNDTVIIQGVKNNIALYYQVWSLDGGIAGGTVYIKNRNSITEDIGAKYTLGNVEGYEIETTIINNNTDNENDDYIWTYDKEQISTITSEVASWLTTNNYGSVEDVINSGNETDINSVLAIFDQVWQPRTV